jgi:hypothetical protein
MQHRVLSDLPVVAVVSMNPRTVDMACEIDIFIRKQQAADTTRKGTKMILLALFYLAAIAILVLHFTGFLARHNLEWLVLVLAISVFPAVIYL